MANISNLNRANGNNVGINEKRISFSKGDIFSGKIKSQESMGKVVVELKDGWMFEALLDDNIEGQLDKDIILKVIGYSNGKLKLHMLCDSEVNNKQNLEEYNEEEGFNLKNIGLSKEDVNFIKSLLKHNIALTKENVSEIKSLINFRDRLINDNKESNEFINKFLISKNILKDSIEGKNITKILDGFIEKFKDLTDEDILLFKNSSIEFSEENIKSLEVIKRDNGIIKTLEDFKTLILKDGEVLEEFRKETDISNSNKNLSNIEVKEDNNDVEILKDVNVKNSKEIIEGIKDLSEFKKYFREEDIKDIIKEFINTSNNKITNKTKDCLEHKLKDIIDRPIEEIFDKLNIKEKEIINKFKSDFLQMKSSKESIKESINLQSKEIKELVKSLLKEDVDIDKVLNTFKEQFNTIKVFNNLSKDMYILDVPVTVQEDTYDCKLIIKDERGKGKKIDSSNVRLFASVSTLNMGDVDALISVLDKNINVNLKIRKNFISIIENGKGVLIDKLKAIGYSPVINVTERTEEIDVSSVIDLLGEEYSKGLNVRV